MGMAERGASHSVMKFLLFGVLYFLLTFSAVIFRDVKDVLIVTAPGGGAQLIPYLKSLAIWEQRQAMIGRHLIPLFIFEKL
jgi:ATP/ADP translocase